MTAPMFHSDTDTVEDALRELREIPQYPFNDSIDRPFVRRLIEDNPRVDLPFEIRKWALWLTEHPEVTKPKRKRTNYRARLLTWVERPFYRSTRSASRTSGAQRPEVYGTTSETLERW